MSRNTYYSTSENSLFCINKSWLYATLYSSQNIQFSINGNQNFHLLLTCTCNGCFKFLHNWVKLAGSKHNIPKRENSPRSNMVFWIMNEMNFVILFCRFLDEAVTKWPIVRSFVMICLLLDHTPPHVHARVHNIVSPQIYYDLQSLLTNVHLYSLHVQQVSLFWKSSPHIYSCFI